MRYKVVTAETLDLLKVFFRQNIMHSPPLLVNQVTAGTPWYALYTYCLISIWSDYAEWQSSPRNSQISAAFFVIEL